MKNYALIFMLLSYPGLFVSLAAVNKVRNIVESNRLKRYWSIVWGMNVFFIVTYAAYIYILTKGGGISSDSAMVDTLIALMFLIGGWWVVFLTKIVGLSATERAKKDLIEKQRLQIQEFNVELGKKLNVKIREVEKNMMEMLQLMGTISKEDEKLEELKARLNKLKKQHV
ncbi:MAG: hypothetical protein WC238_02145 [Parcubacteria group bacterium]|jgi:hypothetical protein